MQDAVTRDLRDIIKQGLADAGLAQKEIKAVEGAGLAERIRDYMTERETKQQQPAKPLPQELTHACW